MTLRQAVAALLLPLLLPADAAFAAEPTWPRVGVELAPFFGLQYGGALASVDGPTYSIDPGMQFGATLDIPVAPDWSVELLYARQDTELASSPRLGFVIERYLAGVRQEKDAGKMRFLGVALLGATRLAPEGYGSEAHFTLAIGLGLRRPLTKHFGVRADVRGYYTVTSSAGGTACVNGNCLYGFASNGVWQGDVTGALSWTF